MRILILLALVGCGDDGTVAKMDAPKAIDAASDGLVIIDGNIDGPSGTSPLTVKNFVSWCSVTVNGGAASTADVQTVNVAPGPITLTAKRASATFEVSGNMWHHTDGDTGNTGEPGTITGNGANTTSTAIVTVAAAAKCVYVCCPFAGGGGCEPAMVPEQCP